MAVLHGFSTAKNHEKIFTHFFTWWNEAEFLVKEQFLFHRIFHMVFHTPQKIHMVFTCTSRGFHRVAPNAHLIRARIFGHIFFSRVLCLRPDINLSWKLLVSIQGNY